MKARAAFKEFEIVKDQLGFRSYVHPRSEPYWLGCRPHTRERTWNTNAPGSVRRASGFVVCSACSVTRGESPLADLMH
jgi:hypothetical protein